uniref:IP15528p n=1 Tax=Drosophila melanogaster TaxID=7227 RepID=Q1EC77_DROME|nr:IP15528p [Drosophila melanogaster]
MNRKKTRTHTHTHTLNPLRSLDQQVVHVFFTFARIFLRFSHTAKKKMIIT